MTSRTARVAAGIVAVLLGAFIVLLATSDSGRSSAVSFEIVGKVAPPIEGPTLSGETFRLQDLRGNWVVVNFFASWCVGCRVEHPELLEFRERHRGENVEMVAVMFGDSTEDAQAFFSELGGDWPALVENTGPVHLDYGVTGVPETLLIAPSGRVLQKWIGASGVTADSIDRAIERASGNG